MLLRIASLRRRLRPTAPTTVLLALSVVPVGAGTLWNAAGNQSERLSYYSEAAEETDKGWG